MELATYHWNAYHNARQKYYQAWISAIVVVLLLVICIIALIILKKIPRIDFLSLSLFPGFFTFLFIFIIIVLKKELNKFEKLLQEEQKTVVDEIEKLHKEVISCKPKIENDAFEFITDSYSSGRQNWKGKFGDNFTIVTLGSPKMIYIMKKEDFQVDKGEKKLDIFGNFYNIELTLPDPHNIGYISFESYEKYEKWKQTEIKKEPGIS